MYEVQDRKSYKCVWCAIEKKYDMKLKEHDCD
jgi:hypothetical protein